MAGRSAMTTSSGSSTAKGSWPMTSLAIRIAWPRPSCSFCRTYAIWARSLIRRTCRSFSISPFSSSRRSSSYDRSKWSSIARFWLEVTMMTCSMPAATASSTAYWMTGLSTRGSISFGCALVAGRNRVPHPAAGNTAFRTRIEPHERERAWDRDLARPGGYHRGLAGPFSQLGGQGADELLEESREDLGLIDVREVAGARDRVAPHPRHARQEPAGADPEDQVERAVD